MLYGLLLVLCSRHQGPAGGRRLCHLDGRGYRTRDGVGRCAIPTIRQCGASRMHRVNPAGNGRFADVDAGLGLGAGRYYMTSMVMDLYNTDILTLSTTLENGELDAPDASVRRVSKLCGSELELDLKLVDGVVSAVALRVKACALGQASAAILQDGIIGANREELITARNTFRAMLKDGGDAPRGRFAKLALLRGVAKYPARHQSALLAFEAAVAAFPQVVDS